MESYTRLFIHLNPAAELDVERQASALEARSPRAALRLSLTGPSALRWSRRARRSVTAR